MTNFEQPGENETQEASDQAQPSRRILVAEDDDDVRLITMTLLEHAGYTVDGAVDGVEAWEALEQNVYDLLLTDNNMPRMSGVDLLNKLHSSHIKIPVILVTGQPPTDELNQNLWLQIEALILKPYTAVGLLAVVENVFNKSDFAGVSGNSKLPGDEPTRNFPNRTGGDNA